MEKRQGGIQRGLKSETARDKREICAAAGGLAAATKEAPGLFD